MSCQTSVCWALRNFSNPGVWMDPTPPFPVPWWFSGDTVLAFLSAREWPKTQFCRYVTPWKEEEYHDTQLPATSSSHHVRQMSLFPSKMKTILLDPWVPCGAWKLRGPGLNSDLSQSHSHLQRETIHSGFHLVLLPHYKSFLSAANSKLVSWNY